MDPNHTNPYLRDAVLTATPEQLQLMLYDGAIRYTTQARDAIERADFEDSYNKLTRAQRIVAEMLNGLNHDVNRELCERVASLYNFIYRKLVDANVSRTVEPIDDALKILRIERKTWQILVEKVSRIRETGGQDEFVSAEATRQDHPAAPAPERPAEAGFVAEG